MGAKTAFFLMGLLVFLPLAAFASECTDQCQSEDNVDQKVAEAQATADAKGFYVGQTDTNCGNSILRARAGEPDTCIVNLNSCNGQCGDDACYGSCNDAFQTCCVQNVRETWQTYLDECLAACGPEQDKCQGVTCFDKCENSKEYRSGSCDPNTGQCTWATQNPCQYGCNGDFCAEAPEQPQAQQKGCTVSTDEMFSYCKAYCQSKTPDDCSVTAASSETPGVLYSCMCMCGQSPDYTYPSYSNIDCTGSAPKRMAQNQPQDRCANVQCDDKCAGTTLETDGNCDPDTGRCTYTETPCGDVGCNATSLTCNEAQGGRFAGRFYYTEFNLPNGGWAEKGTQVPLRNLKVEFSYTGPDGNYNDDTKNWVAYTDSDGKFSWDAPAEFFTAGNRIEVDAVMADENNKLFESTDRLVNSGGGGTYAVIVAPSLSPADQELGDMEIDFKSLGPDQALAAQVYANLLKAVEFKETVLGATSTTKERATIFSASGTWHTTELDPSGGGMFINSADSHYYTAEAPVNREYHEYCHHIQDETWGQDSTIIPPGIDHKGYPINNESGWGYSEGWAEFCAMQMVKHISGIQDVRYVVGNTALNLEFNYNIRDGLKSDEEFAIAGIMLDLTDSASDYSYGKDDDSVSLPLSTVWAAISTARDLGDGKTRKPLNLHDFYVAISDEAGAGQQAGIDAIFISHGAYQDLNKNGKWDPGEPVGYSGQGNAASDLRPNVKPEEGTQVAVSGGTGLLADVNVAVDGPMSYLSYSYRTPIVDGKVYLPTVPSWYDATITVKAVDGSTGTSSTKSYVTTNTALRQNIDPSKAIGSYDPALTATAGPCASDGQCISWNAGDTCRDGSCVYATPTANGPNTQPSSTPGCCGSSAVLLAVLAGAGFAVGRRH